MMGYFFDTTETIVDKVGFNHYSLLHIVWLTVFVLFVVGLTKVYKKADAKKKEKIKKGLAYLIIADELFKMVGLVIGGNYTWDYLPLHLCSINIFVIAWHAYKPNRLLDNFLYLVCIPGAMAALLFPSWNALPLMNFMHIHSFTVHILLAAYPLMLLFNHEIKPDAHYIKWCVLTLLIMAIVIYGVNLVLDTNFMFLMKADTNNPLYIFKQLFGSHLIGFPVIIIPLILIMYAPYFKRKAQA